MDLHEKKKVAHGVVVVLKTGANAALAGLACCATLKTFAPVTLHQAVTVAAILLCAGILASLFAILGARYV